MGVGIMNTEKARLDFLGKVETGVVTDAMNLLRMDGWMEDILPVQKDAKICGRAFTVQFSAIRDPGQKVFNMFSVFDLCKPGDIVVVSADTNGAVVGENMMHAMENKQLAGMVLAGRTRDWGVIAKMKIPHFSCGPAIRLATNYKIAAVQVPILCKGTVVEPGDYIVGDCDGVISIPQKSIDDVIYQAEMVADVEAQLEDGLNRNLSMDEIVKISAGKKSPRQMAL